MLCNNIGFCSITPTWGEKKERKKEDLNVATSTNYGLAPFWVGLSLYVISKHALWEPQKTIASFRRWPFWMGIDKPTDTYLPWGQVPSFPHGWLKMSSSPNIPTMIGWTIGDRVHQKSSVRKFTHPFEYYYGLRQLNHIVVIKSSLKPCNLAILGVIIEHLPYRLVVDITKLDFKRLIWSLWPWLRKLVW